MNNNASYVFLKNNNTPAARVYFISDHCLRISFARDNQFGEAGFANDVLLAHDKILPKQEGDKLVYGAIYLWWGKENAITLAGNNQTFLRLKAKPDAKKPCIEIATKKNEGLYGFGEWFNGFRREEDKLTIHNLESPAFSQNKHTYSAIPCFLSDQGYLVFVLNAHKASAKINTKRSKSKLVFEGGNLDLVVIYGPSWKKIISEYTGLTGRPPLLPLWSFGLWNTAYPIENQEQILKRINEHRKRKIALDAIILDYHWQEGFSNFKWRKSVITDPDAMIQNMKKNNIKLGLIYTPYINRDSYPLYKLLVRSYVKNGPDAVSFISKDYAKNVYDEGIRSGYFSHPNTTWWFGRGGAVDFTNPEAVNWWFGMQKPLLDQGVYFFKNDGAEYLPDGSKSFIGLDPKEYHNIYCFYYTKALFEKCQGYHGNKRALVFSRTNWIGTQRYPGIFLGDQTPKFKHIAATMRCGLNMSLLGYSYWGADVLALYKKPSKTLHKRYSQWSLFTPIARYFSNPDDSNRNPWGIDPDCEENFKRHLNLRMQLLPYFYRLAYEAYKTGMPIIRPLFLEFQDDEETKPIWEQVMVGDNIMMAPVLKSKIKKQQIYFPQGTWYSWWDDSIYHGPKWHEVAINEGHVPLFVRGIVVLGPKIQFIPEDHRFDALAIHLYPPFEGSTDLYEDDGTTTGYMSGKCSLQTISVSHDKTNHMISVVFEPATGSFENQPKHRSITLVMHGIGKVINVLKGETLLGSDSVHEDKILTIDTMIPVKEQTEIRILLDHK